jgi:NAD(P)-dependent dehydrogenase (short-subunit alcohol dehydrogenase family)
MTEKRKTIVVTRASSGFGEMTSRALAEAGHTVHAGMRDTDGQNSLSAAKAHDPTATHAVRLVAIDMDVSSQESVDHAIAEILSTIQGSMFLSAMPDTWCSSRSKHSRNQEPDMPRQYPAELRRQAWERMLAGEAVKDPTAFRSS